MRVYGVIAAAILVIISALVYFAYFNQRLLNFYHEAEMKSSMQSKGLEEVSVEKSDKNEIEKIMKVMRNEDKVFYESMMMDASNFKDKSQLIDHFFKVMTDCNQGVCRTTKKMGGRYISGSAKAVDGDKVVCLDRIIRTGSCLIYSFGISNDWSFEDTADKMGCEIYAYDHSIDAPPTRGANIKYFKNGIGASKDGLIDTMHNFMAANGHLDTTIDYLKMDVEGYEFAVLPQMIEDGTIDKVDQIALEIHGNLLFSSQSFEPVLKTFQTLYTKGFRLISFMPNLVMGRMKNNDNYYSLCEIVLKKDNEWNFLD